MNVPEVKVERSDNENESALCLGENISESSLEIESMIIITEGISKRTYLSINNLNFALFSVHFLMQVKQGGVKIFMTSTIPSPIEEAVIFQGIAYFYHLTIEEYNA